jgi:MFS family permease
MIYVSLALFGVGAIMVRNARQIGFTPLIHLLTFHRWVLQAAVTYDSMTLLLAGRAIQGVGGGGILVLSEIVVTDLVPLRFRGNFFSMCRCSLWID